MILWRLFLFNFIVIHDPNDPYLNDYDEEMIVMLTDYHHTDASILVNRFLAPGGASDEVIIKLI